MAEDNDNELAGISLMDLAGLDVSGLEAKHAGEILPRCLADFECEEAELQEVKDKDDKLKGFRASFAFKVLGVHTVIDKEVKEEDLIGRKHFESRFIKNEDGIKYLLGFLEEIGVKHKGKLGDLVNAAKGKRVKAVCAHRKDKNDSDVIYAGLKKIKPLATAA